MESFDNLSGDRGGGCTMAVLPDNATDLSEFRLRIEGAEDHDLRVLAFDGTEAISELFSFRIQLGSGDHSVEPSLMLGRAASLEIETDHQTRLIHGIIACFEQTGGGVHQARYEALLVPPHWLLTKRVQSRVFNEKRCPRMDVLGIVSKVLTDAGLRSEDLRPALSGDYEAREYVVQYRESDWDFIARLLEAEGICFFFDHAPGGCKLVLMDSKDLHEPFAKTGFEVPFRDPSGMVEEREFVFRARFTDRVQFGAVSLNDFDFRRPDAGLRRSRSAARFGGLALHDYPGDYRDEQRGQRLVETRLEELQFQREMVAFEATARELRPGYRFTLIEHPDPRFNLDYLVLSLLHRATQPQSAEEEAESGAGVRYGVDIQAIPASVQFRPPRCTPRPTILGSQSAIVVGPPGEEIHTDAFGRVEVRFHWDYEARHDAGASCWIRVSQGMAGGNYGMLFLPRVGQEVIVDFLEGRPDQPIIIGRVYNADHMPPYPLPESRSISAIRTCSTPGGGGGNEIRFDDARSGEQLLLFAQKELHLRAQGNRFESTRGDRHATVAGNGYELIQKSLHREVRLDRLELVGGNAELLVKGDIREACEASKRSVFAGERTVSAESIRFEANSIELNCLGNVIKLDAVGITILGSKVSINSGGAASSPLEFPLRKELIAPGPAALTEFGHDRRYDAKPESLDRLDPNNVAPAAPEQPVETSWIEIEQIDDAGRPCAGQRYEIKLPDGSTRRGRLDAHGLAHVALPSAGDCKVTFPDLDAAAWEPIG